MTRGKLMVLWFLGRTPRQRHRIEELKATRRGWAIYAGILFVTSFIAITIAVDWGMVAGFAVLLLVSWPIQAAYLHWSGSSIDAR